MIYATVGIGVRVAVGLRGIAVVTAVFGWDRVAVRIAIEVGTIKE